MSHKYFFCLCKITSSSAYSITDYVKLIFILFFNAGVLLNMNLCWENILLTFSKVHQFIYELRTDL